MPQQFIVDAFEAGPFTGNPAAVVPLENWLDVDIMLSIAAENNLSETAFFVPGDNLYHLRWFTPTHEVPLCGHATLATAHVLWSELGTADDSIGFQTQSGRLGVSRAAGYNRYTLDFPFAALSPHENPDAVLSALNLDGEVHFTEGTAFVVTDAPSVRAANPDLKALSEAANGLAIITALAEDDLEVDVIARVFAPGFGIPEDPATGSAHCAIAPYWSEQLGKTVIRSFQASARGGHFECEVAGERVLISGSCRTFARGELADF